METSQNQELNQELKIKGSNYNFFGLDYKITKNIEDQIRNIHFLKRRRFLRHYSSPSSKSADVQEPFQQMPQIA
jgi:hypothetical protein